MNGDQEHRRRRQEDNLRMGRELAAKLAVAADSIAATLDELAEVHLMLSVMEGHPLAEGANGRAVAERELADQERDAAEWFRSIAAGTNRPASAEGP